MGGVELGDPAGRLEHHRVAFDQAPFVAEGATAVALAREGLGVPGRPVELDVHALDEGLFGGELSGQQLVSHVVLSPSGPQAARLPGRKAASLLSYPLPPAADGGIGQNVDWSPASMCHARAVKVYISVDMEGVAGISDWEQCLAGGDDYQLGRDLVLGEVNAAIDGALEAGATEFLVNDSHSLMRNLPPGELGGHASYLSGRFKPLYMMEGLDPSYDVALFLGYHAAMTTPGILSHTYNPRAIANVTLNGTVTGEAGINALVAMHHGVPIEVITGDQYVGPEAAPFCPGINVIEVKTSSAGTPPSTCTRTSPSSASARASARHWRTRRPGRRHSTCRPRSRCS
jgi:D-aminopeptidase